MQTAEACWRDRAVTAIRVKPDFAYARAVARPMPFAAAVIRTLRGWAGGGLWVDGSMVG